MFGVQRGIRADQPSIMYLMSSKESSTWQRAAGQDTKVRLRAKVKYRNINSVNSGMQRKMYCP